MTVTRHGCGGKPVPQFSATGMVCQNYNITLKLSLMSLKVLHIFFNKLGGLFL